MLNVIFLVLNDDVEMDEFELSLEDVFGSEQGFEVLQLVFGVPGELVNDFLALVGNVADEESDGFILVYF